MILTLPGLVATGLLFASGLRQFRAFQRGLTTDSRATWLAWFGLFAAIVTVWAGFVQNGGQPTTALMGALLGTLLTALVIATSLHQPVNTVLIGVAPITGIFTLLAVLVPSRAMDSFDISTAIHVVSAILAYGAVAYAGTLALLVSWHHEALKKRPLPALVAALPPLDAMDSLFFRAVQAAWILLTLSLISGALYVEDFWAQHLAHKTILSGLAWIGMSVALIQHLQQGGINRTMRRTAVAAAALLCLGYLGSKAVLEFLIAA
jgi:ABC-type uncharacterized transport system permease subunit